MSAPLRLIAAAPRRERVGPPVGPIDPWLTRLVKLVPAEVVAVYLAGRPLAHGALETAWPIIALVLVVIVRAWGTADRRGPQWISVVVSAFSFMLWVWATGGHFGPLVLDPDRAGLAVLVWTTLVPVIWKGDPPA